MTVSSRQHALDALWEQQKEASYKEGIHQGQSEAFASMVIYGQCTIMAQTIPVSFEWPSAEFAALVRDMSRHVLERAHAEGRQAGPPPVQ